MQPVLTLVDQPKSRHQDTNLHPFFLHRLGQLPDKIGYLTGLKKRIDFAGNIQNTQFRHNNGFYKETRVQRYAKNTPYSTVNQL